MLIEATRDTITYKLRDGQIVVLLPGVPIDLPDQAGQRLLRKAGDKVRLFSTGVLRSVALQALAPLTVELDGQVIQLEPGAIFTATAEQAERLLQRAPGKIQTITLPPDLPTSPLQPGWLVAYRDHDGRLCGGCDDRQRGTVQECRWDGSTWTVTLTDGQTLPLAAILSVGKTDAAGGVVAAWTVRTHGYDGEGKR